jgi:hypothetical protein
MNKQKTAHVIAQPKPPSPCRRHRSLALALAFGCSLTARAQTDGGVVSPIQSTAHPFGLSIVAPVMQGGSDASAANFQNNLLPAAQQFIAATLPERQNATANSALFNLDFNRLRLQTDQNVRAYFVSSSPGHNNTIGFNTTGSGVNSGNPKLIFPDASGALNSVHNGTGTRSPGQPLLPGDFVNLGMQSRGTLLDFFLVANGAANGTTVYSTTGNPDAVRHAASFTPRLFAVPQLNSPYIFISFEDLRSGPGDRTDYNDTVIALDVGRGTVNYLLGAPEPSLYLTLGGFLALAIWGKRRLNQAQPALAPCQA